MNVKTADLCRATNLLQTAPECKPNRVLNFEKISGVIPADPTYWELCPQTPGERGGREGEEGRGKGRGEGGGKGK